MRRVAFLAALSLVAAACGGGGGDDVANKLTVLSHSDVDYIDCGQAYARGSFQICAATQRALYGHKPGDPTTMVPDLARSSPRVSDAGRTVTVKLRSNVRFSPPVNRVVTSRDVKYAIERGFFSTVSNAYSGAYFGDIVGAKPGVKPGTRIAGIATPSADTIVFHLSKPTGGLLADGALALPLTAPVPEAYARRYDDDASGVSSYGPHQVATGPYMVRTYQPGREIVLVRNPNWRRASDFKPAHLDEIVVQEGTSDRVSASRRILRGRSLVNGDFSPPSGVLKKLTRRERRQVVIAPGDNVRWVSMNTTIPPFDDIDVRRAVVAGFDRAALLDARGGSVIGRIPTHFLPPGANGFAQAGGVKGPGFAFLNATGRPDPRLSAAYFRRAGYRSGRYTGKQTLLMVGEMVGVSPRIAEAAKRSFERMGFRVKLKLALTIPMYTKYCNVPAAQVAICANVGWPLDFEDGQTMLDPTFNGAHISPANNSNWSQLDVPSVNRAMAKAEVAITPAARGRAWAAVDRLVTAQAPAIPWAWDTVPLIESRNVRGVVDRANSNWALAWTSLK
jgi:peptide/nickel transport system substrate-binding protein